MLAKVGFGVAGLVLWAAAALAQLKAGDIAFIEYSTDGDDDFAWVALRQIPASTVIKFTDSSVSNVYFRWSEHIGDTVSPGPLCWVHSNAVPAGTVVRWSGGLRQWSMGVASGAAPNLSNEGDQLIAYCGTIVRKTTLRYPWQGDAGGATMLHALNFANSGWNNISGGDTSSSFVPPGLSTNDCTAVHVSRLHNAFYDGTTSGSAAQILKAVANPANWQQSNEVSGVVGWIGSRGFVIRPTGTVLSIQ